MSYLKKATIGFWLRCRESLSTLLNGFLSNKSISNVIKIVESDPFNSVWIKSDNPLILRDTFLIILNAKYYTEIDTYKHEHRYFITHNNKSYVFSRVLPSKEEYKLYNYVFEWEC